MIYLNKKYVYAHVLFKKDASCVVRHKDCDQAPHLLRPVLIWGPRTINVIISKADALMYVVLSNKQHVPYGELICNTECITRDLRSSGMLRNVDWLGSYRRFGTTCHSYFQEGQMGCPETLVTT